MGDAPRDCVRLNEKTEGDIIQGKLASLVGNIGGIISG